LSLRKKSGSHFGVLVIVCGLLFLQLAIAAERGTAVPIPINEWTNMNPATKPLGRWEHAMAYDSESDRVIMFAGMKPGVGGSCRCIMLADTWAYNFNTNTWTNMNPPIPKPLGR